MTKIAIKTLQAVESQHLPGQAPHSHADYLIIWVQAASAGWHELDFAHYTLQAPQIFFLKPQQMHYLAAQAPRGYILQFNQDHLCALGISDQYLESLELFGPSADPPFFNLNPEETEILESLFQALCSELNQATDAWQDDMAATWLKLFLLTCARFKNNQPTKALPLLDEDQKWVRAFFTLLETHYAQSHKVQFYAEQLHLSSDLLNQKLRSLTHKTAKEHIQEQIMLAAKRAAYFSDESAKQVAYRLGFEDPAHFSKFFKNCAGESFSAFRHRVREKYTS